MARSIGVSPVAPDQATSKRSSPRPVDTRRLGGRKPRGQAARRLQIAGLSPALSIMSCLVYIDRIVGTVLVPVTWTRRRLKQHQAAFRLIDRGLLSPLPSDSGPF